MGVMFDAMFPKFASRSKKNKEGDIPPIVTEEELLLVNGRGINTWYVNFHGNTEGGEPIDFSYRLNITSVQFGMKAVRMYDSLLTVTYNDEVYKCERDYAMIKNKQHVPLDYLFFMGNLSKIEGNFKLIELYGVMTNYEVDVRLSCEDKNVKKGFLQLADDENSPQDMFAADMSCSGRIMVEGVAHDVTGRAWVEKRYIPVAKGSGNNTAAGSIKLCLFADEDTDSELAESCGNQKDCTGTEKIPHIAVHGYYDEKAGKERVRVLAVNADGAYECYEAESIFENAVGSWESPMTGKHYPFPLVVKVPELELDIKVVPSVYEQEMLAEDGVYSEYAGSGYYTGMCADESVSGACSIEMIGEFKK